MVLYRRTRAFSLTRSTVMRRVISDSRRLTSTSSCFRVSTSLWKAYNRKDNVTKQTIVAFSFLQNVQLFHKTNCPSKTDTVWLRCMQAISWYFMGWLFHTNSSTDIDILLHWSTHTVTDCTSQVKLSHYTNYTQLWWPQVLIINTTPLFQHDPPLSLCLSPVSYSSARINKQRK